MNNKNILVTVIATSERPSLLMRTLQSINECVLPDTYEGVYVIENGPKSGVEKLIADNNWNFKIIYDYIIIKNKCKALNVALNKLDNQLIYFNDDDVRLAKGALLSMHKAASSLGRNVYFGGPLQIDYETNPPEEWLKPYLPQSAKGFHYKWKCVVSAPSHRFLGANWAAYAYDLKRAGGFNELIGPERVVIGDETRMQDILYKMRIKPYYVPEALVWHFVPKRNCSQRFAIVRTFKTAVFEGVYCHKMPLSIIRSMVKSFLVIILCVMRIIYHLLKGNARWVYDARVMLTKQVGFLTGIFLLAVKSIGQPLKKGRTNYDES